MSIFKEKHPLVILVRKLAFLRILKWPMLLLMVFGSLNYSGFCFKEMRYLSDEEKIRGAIAANHTIKGNQKWRRSSYDKLGRVSEYEVVIPYADVDEFLRENPNCCRVIYKGFADDRPPGFFEKIFGTCNYGVRMTYTYRYIKKPLKEPIDENVKGGAEKRERTLNEIKGEKHERLIRDHLYTAGNCGQFCGGDENDFSIITIYGIVHEIFRFLNL